MASEQFQVDLRGMVEILSHHLYSSPRVYLRELLQNACDAISARRDLDPTGPATIEIDVSRPGTLAIRDSGIGLSEGEMRELLATIGASSKPMSWRERAPAFSASSGSGCCRVFW